MYPEPHMLNGQNEWCSGYQNPQKEEDKIDKMEDFQQTMNIAQWMNEYSTKSSRVEVILKKVRSAVGWPE